MGHYWRVTNRTEFKCIPHCMNFSNFFIPLSISCATCCVVFIEYITVEPYKITWSCNLPPPAVNGGFRSPWCSSNINSTAHILYQLIGGRMFLHRGHHHFERRRLGFLFRPPAAVKMNESFMNVIAILPSWLFLAPIILCGISVLYRSEANGL